MEEEVIVLIPIAMRCVNPDFIHAPSVLQPEIKTTKSSMKHMTGSLVLVSLEKDGISNPGLRASYLSLSNPPNRYIVKIS